jgi:uncharacterized membrane protein YdcZ (DUF606 family)
MFPSLAFFASLVITTGALLLPDLTTRESIALLVAGLFLAGLGLIELERD